MSLPSFSDWLLLKEGRRRRPSPAKNSAIDAFLKSVEELEKDVEKLSKYQKSADAKKKDGKKDDKKVLDDEEEEEKKDAEESKSEDEEKEVD